VVALVGPNGAGKTTLLHLAVGLLGPSAGEVRVFGAPPANRPQVLARVGFLAQDKPLYHGFTVAEMLRYGARLNPGWDQAVADGWLERFDLPADRRVGQLSGGQRTQLAVALTLARRPRLLLLDEPMADLDPLVRHDLARLLMETVAAEGLTVVVSSHVLAELASICDYLVLLAVGRVQLADDTEALLAGHKLLVGRRRDPPTARTRWWRPATPSGRPPCWCVPSARSTTPPGRSMTSAWSSWCWPTCATRRPPPCPARP
jgi:ABC-2 type transport system ATP-binding protein